MLKFPDDIIQQVEKVGVDFLQQIEEVLPHASPQNPQHVRIDLELCLPSIEEFGNALDTVVEQITHEL